jgi:DNA polymerase I-like protein with 3'-5' exonuclease and polymerase domains
MKPNIFFISERPQPHLSYETITLDEVVLPDICCLDLETTGLSFNKNNILLVILGNKETQYVIDYNFVDKIKLFSLLNTPKLFIGHNLSFDLPWLIHRGCEFSTGTIYDTMETELTLIKGTMHSASLKNTLKRRLVIDTLDKNITIEFTYMSPTEPYFEDRHINYAAEDVLYLEDTKDAQMAHINKLGQQELTQVNNDMVVVTSYMKVKGMYLNKDKWMKLYYHNIKMCDQLELQMDEELKRIGLPQKPRVKQRYVQTDLLGGTVDVVNKNINNINYASPDQIKQIFKYFKLTLPKVFKKVKGKESKEEDTTGTAELEEYLLSKPNIILAPFLRLLIDYRVYKKRVSTYGQSFLEKYLDNDGRIRSDFKINRTATGRMSSSNPNVQNVPALSAFRECFEGKGTNNIYTCDLSQAELRILASLADDDVLKRLFNEGKDLHSYLATPVFRYLYGDQNATVSKKENADFRTLMKTVNFGIAYGASGSKIGKVLNVPKAKGDKVLQIMEDTIPKTFEFLENQSLTGQTVGKIKFDNVYNQIRYFENVIKGEKLSEQALAAIGRESKNCAIQGQNGQMVKLALVNIFNYIREHNLKSFLISTVHDEIVVEVVEGEEVHCDIYKKFMQDCSNYFLEGVKMEAEGGLAKVWSK